MTTSTSSTTNESSTSPTFDLIILEELQSIIKEIIVHHLQQQQSSSSTEVGGEEDDDTNNVPTPPIDYPFDHLLDEELNQLIDNDEEPTLFIDRLHANQFNYDQSLQYLTILKNNKLYYPPKPYYKHIGIVLYAWGVLQRFPVSFNQLYGLNETVVVKGDGSSSSSSVLPLLPPPSPDTVNSVDLPNNNNNNNISGDKVTTTTTTIIPDVDTSPSLPSNTTEQTITTITTGCGLDLTTNESHNPTIQTIPTTPVVSINQLTNQNNTNTLIQIMYRWKSMSHPERVEQVYQFLKPLTMRCILTMFGVRKTVGSVDKYFPPGPIKLINTSNQLHSPRSASKLTVSSRALCKHGIRSENSFWGPGTGPEPVKNLRAEKVMLTILSDPTWINIHLLPHNITIIEIRNNLGYGLRWDASGESFRGYLEPQMEDGHEKGWRH